MTKSDLKALIRECLHEELTLAESSLTSEEKVDAWHNGTRRENYRAAGLPKLTDFYNIAERKGYTDIVKIIEGEFARRGLEVPSSTETKEPTTMDWDNLLIEADKLLEELCAKSGNADWDDSDGYWSAEEGYQWTMRKLFYGAELKNSYELGELCAVYSKKLPNVEFYYYEDDFLEDSVSEIGYTATNPDYKEEL